jgi:hypothetical protein
MNVETLTFKKSEATCALDLKPGEWCFDKGWVFVRCWHDAHQRVGMIHQYGVANEKHWKIDMAGKVNPSIWWKGGECDTHIYGILEGWVPFQGETK